MDKIIADYLTERFNQDIKWGQQNHPDGTDPKYLKWAERFKEINGDSAKNWAEILLEEVFEALGETELKPLRAELVQVMAVAGAHIDHIDRRLEFGEMADQWVRCPVCVTEWIKTDQVMCSSCAKK